MADNVISKLRKSTGRVRLHLADGSEVKVVIEEMTYAPAERYPEGLVNSGSYYASLVETGGVADVYDLPAKPESLLGVYATEESPGEWDTARLSLSEVYVDQFEDCDEFVAEIDSVERID